MVDLITENLDLWSGAYIAKKTVGRGNSTRSYAYGIQKLRELILQLAVMGKLVPQDPNDEPATVLLEKIAQEKESLVKEVKSKKQIQLAKISEDEKVFDLPNGWEWVRLYQVIQISSGDGLTATQMAEEGDVPVFGGNGITGYHDKANTFKQTLVIGRVGYYCGSIHLTPPRAWVTDNAFQTKFSEDNINIHFLYWLLKGTDLKENENATAQPVISGRKIYPIVIGLPPKNEQDRIVAKVDELMTLCDHFEEQQNENSEAHQTLVETLLNAITSTKDAQEFQESWNRIAKHFDILFTTEQSIDTLKQTILQLAVMGKLVPQDLNDEPATVLLEKIALEKERLIEEEKIKKQTKLSEISEDEKVFALPNGWEWCYLQNIVYILSDGLHGTPEYSPNEKYFFINGNNLKDGKIIIKQDTKTVSYDEYLKYKKDLNKNSVLVSINGTLGNVAFYNNEDIILGKSACYFNLANNIDKSFIKILIESPIFYSYAFHNATGSTIKNLGLAAMNAFVIALPPVAEQHRIVAKVNELMALCDTLKQRIEDARTTQIHLADAIVEQAVNRA